MANNKKQAVVEGTATVREAQVIEHEHTVSDETQVGFVGELPAHEMVEVDENTSVSLQTMFEDVSSAFYCSIVNDGSRESAIKIYNAMNSAATSIRDLEEPIIVTDIIAHTIQLLDEETGELSDATRVVLIDEKGKGYHAVANGVVSSIQKIVGIVGRAPWNPGLKMKPRLVKTRKGFYTLTLELLV